MTYEWNKMISAHSQNVGRYLVGSVWMRIRFRAAKVRKQRHWIVSVPGVRAVASLFMV